MMEVCISESCSGQQVVLLVKREEIPAGAEEARRRSRARSLVLCVTKAKPDHCFCRVDVPLKVKCFSTILRATMLSVVVTATETLSEQWGQMLSSSTLIGTRRQRLGLTAQAHEHYRLRINGQSVQTPHRCLFCITNATRGLRDAFAARLEL